MTRPGSDAAADVIVVGAGSAGVVVASRLSEDESRSVLLLEAGPDFGPSAAAQPRDVTDAENATATDFDWRHIGTSSGLSRDMPLYAGRLVGGSSATNNVMALRGHPAGYDAWDAAGNPGWSFADVLPSFRLLEHDLDFAADPWHGDSGPIPIHRPFRRQVVDEQASAQRAFLDACAEAGHEKVIDHNAPGSVGAGAFAPQRGRRCASINGPDLPEGQPDAVEPHCSRRRAC